MSNLGIINMYRHPHFLHNLVLLNDKGASQFCFPVLYLQQQKRSPINLFLGSSISFLFWRSKIFNSSLPGIPFIRLHLWFAMNVVRGFPEHKAYWKKILSHYDFIFLTYNLKAKLFCFVLFFPPFSSPLSLSDLFSVRKKPTKTPGHWQKKPQNT